MCGIAGILNYKNHAIEGLPALLNHRGPDGDGRFYDRDFLMYHARLAIQDIKDGKQPMAEGSCTIIFNGEIYNHHELRRQHLPGVAFKTRSDTETLLKLYLKIGTAALDHLDGMFAFAIYDAADRSVFLARDRAGKKPLYYRLDAKHFMFASEINALKTMTDFSVDENMIPAFLRLGFIPGAATIYKEMRELSPGGWLKVALDDLRGKEERWWRFRDGFNLPSVTNWQDAVFETDRLLTLAVKRRLDASDLEVGVFLSGGIDSALVTAIAAKHKPDIRAFTVALHGGYDESGSAMLTAAHTEVNHTIIPINFDKLPDEIPDIIARYGEPFADSSAIPSFYVAREAKKHLTVVMNGDGADELFGGYRRHVPYRYRDFFSDQPVTSALLKTVNSLLPQPRERMSLYNYIYRLAKLGARSGINGYLAATTDIFEGHESVLQDGGALPEDLSRRFAELCRDSKLSGLKKLMLMDFDTVLCGDLLVKMDIATMSHSLEARSPFLSRELLRYAPRLDDSFKIRGVTTKFILRELAKKYIPTKITRLPKRGFEIPLKSWMDGVLKTLIGDTLATGAWCRRFIDEKFLDALIKGKSPVWGDKRAKMLWTLFCLETWKRRACA